MKNTNSRAWLYDLFLILILVGGAYLRTVGLNWDQSQHLHPDERFLTMVEGGITPLKCAEFGTPIELCPDEQKRWMGLGDYFDTATSTLNPHNRGYGFFVYGTLPIFIVRIVGELIGQTGYDEINIVGRQLSALADLFSIVLLYFIVARIYNRKAALLAAAFASVSVMLIQQSHFFAVDTFVNFFVYLAIYFAAKIAYPSDEDSKGFALNSGDSATDAILRNLTNPFFLNSMWFGWAAGMAAASKINGVAIAVLLPVAFAIRYFSSDRKPTTDDGNSPSTVHGQSSNLSFEKIVLFVLIGALFTLLSFRVFQPYAFRGDAGGFFDVRPNQLWVDNIRSQLAQAQPDADAPPALQWARRPIYFSGYNLTVWGLGLPLGILAWCGFLLMAWRMLRGGWKRHILLWLWVLLYFGWQSTQFNSTMRYQLPVYPALAAIAAWTVIEGFKTKRDDQDDPDSLVGVEQSSFTKLLPTLINVVGVVVLIATALWAFAFTRIYTRDHSRVQATRWIYENVPGPLNVVYKLADGSTHTQPLNFPNGFIISAGQPYEAQFLANVDGEINTITLGHAVDTDLSGAQSLIVTLFNHFERKPESMTTRAGITENFAPKIDPRGEKFTLAFAQPIKVTKNETVYLRFETTGGSLTFSGSAPANETSWDDGLPLRMDGYDGYGGMYQGSLNFEMYWTDNVDKLLRFQSTLDTSEYVFISSNRQWGTTTRIPERYPLTVAFYRNLIGCPDDKEIIWCYNVAKPGQFEEKLGYELIQVFESYPTLGAFSINDQFAEEAFTVYDHPKVLLFKKTNEYSSQNTAAILGAVDLSKVIQLTPGQASDFKSDITLPADRWESQQAGGTWSELYDRAAIYNANPWVGVVVWYLFILLLGLFTYPILRLAFPGLNDKGYPLARLAGLIIWAWLSWMLASFNVPYTRLTIGGALAFIVLLGVFCAYYDWENFRQELKTKGKYFLTVEGVFLAFFALDLLIRLGNPDLWHPAKGGERPMNFSYFNAILKSTSFPPYDPWFAGGYINYYYYGYVIVGTPVKFLGIVPSLAFNFILPTLFAMLACAGFSIVWNLIDDRPQTVDGGTDGQPSTVNSRFISSIFGSVALVLLGNLGIIRMFWQGFQKIASQGVPIETLSLTDKLVFAVKGLFMMFSGSTFPYGPGDWYWNPSRVIPAPGEVEPITEFPFFTFIFSDLHAHMIALPLTALAIIFAIALIKGKAKWDSKLGMGLAFFIGALTVGALRPTNTWDFPTYLVMCVLAIGYAYFKKAQDSEDGSVPFIQALAGIGVFAILAFILYQPFSTWYVQGYGAVERWTGTHTPITSYITHWGLFLFVLSTWMAWETRNWLAVTPLSSLEKLRPYQLLIEVALALLLALILGTIYLGVRIGWIALLLAFWALVLILRPNQDDMKRAVLFMVGTGLFITLVVEIIRLKDDISRMNTVFKFYMQVWVMFAVSSAAAVGWMLPDMPKWKDGWRNSWQVVGGLLLFGAFLFTVFGGMGKIQDRWIREIPHTLDAMDYMQYADYSDQGLDMPLDEDFRAIKWMQDNVQGSPVIVEANCPEYRWCSRFTIYTGLPSVVGWNWHQRQQRLFTAPKVEERVAEIGQFYLTDDPEAAKAFLKKYNVKYIVVGYLELAYFGPGLGKFELLDGKLWRAVYTDAHTVIYEVLP